jgi:sentrin-specific protease 7
MPGKRRKTDDVISLVDDDDEVLEISRPDHGSPAGASRDRPCSAWSLHSHMSNGSESTMGDVKPPQATSEFREADSLLRPSQKKPRSSNSNTSKRGVRHSPFAGGSLSISPGADTTRRNILQSFQQGEAKQSPVKNDSAGRKGDILTSKFFPDARINESTSDQIEDNLRVKVDNEDLRAQHRPVPKQSGSIIDSYSADELAITPPRQATKFSSRHKQQQTANSGAKRDIRKRVVEELWPLSFARSYEFEGFGSTSNDGHATLVLRWKKDEGLRVQTWDPVDGIYDCKIIIQPKDVNKICADDTSRIRLLGPRRHDGSVLSLDLEFADTDDFLVFRNDHAVLMTLGGKLVAKSEDHMARLFQTPLQPRNEKAGTSALVHDSTASLEKSHREKGHVVSKTPLMDQLKHAAHQPKSDAKPDAITASEALTRPVRARRSAPISYINDTATQVDVSKFSVETGLGQPWTR